MSVAEGRGIELSVSANEMGEKDNIHDEEGEGDEDIREEVVEEDEEVEGVEFMEGGKDEGMGEGGAVACELLLFGLRDGGTIRGRQSGFETGGRSGEVNEWGGEINGELPRELMIEGRIGLVQNELEVKMRGETGWARQWPKR